MIRQRFPNSPKRHYHDLECDETPAGGECSGEPEECFDNAHCELVQVLINQGYAQVFPEIFAPSYGELSRNTSYCRTNAIPQPGYPAIRSSRHPVTPPSHHLHRHTHRDRNR